MGQKINVDLKVQIVNGPQITLNPSLSVEAYDKIEVTVPKHDGTNPGTATVAVQPGAAGKVQFLLITSSVYDDNLSYVVDTTTTVKLNAPQLLIGDGAVGLLGATQNSFAFSNNITTPAPADAAVQILVGRDAT